MMAKKKSVAEEHDDDDKMVGESHDPWTHPEDRPMPTETKLSEDKAPTRYYLGKELNAFALSGQRVRMINTSAENLFFEGEFVKRFVTTEGLDVMVVRVDRQDSGHVGSFIGQFAIKDGWALHPQA